MTFAFPPVNGNFEKLMNFYSSIDGEEKSFNPYFSCMLKTDENIPENEKIHKGVNEEETRSVPIIPVNRIYFLDLSKDIIATVAFYGIGKGREFLPSKVMKWFGVNEACFIDDVGRVVYAKLLDRYEIVDHPEIYGKYGDYAIDSVVVHRDPMEGPAITTIKGKEEYRSYGLFHRLDGPAKVEKGVSFWMKNGRIHRDAMDGPAVMIPLVGGQIQEVYYEEGKPCMGEKVRLKSDAVYQSLDYLQMAVDLSQQM